MLGGNRARGPDFRAARIGAAGTLLGVLVAILLIDAFDPTYQVDAVVVTAVLGTLGTLLGIEGLAALRNPPPNGRPDLPTSAFDRDTRDPPEA